MPCPKQSARSFEVNHRIHVEPGGRHGDNDIGAAKSEPAQDPDIPVHIAYAIVLAFVVGLFTFCLVLLNRGVGIRE